MASTLRGTSIAILRCWCASGLAALVFLPFLRTRGNSLKTVGLYMLVGAMQLGVMYMLSFRAYLYLTVSELLLFTVLTPLYITLIYDIMRSAVCAGDMLLLPLVGGDWCRDYSL